MLGKCYPVKYNVFIRDPVLEYTYLYEVLNRLSQKARTGEEIS
jgi:hypothetical protein